MAMEFHRGRMIDHIHLVVRDVSASRNFYGSVLAVFGIGIDHEGDGWFSADELFVSGGEPLTGRVHIAFQSRDRRQVEAFHETGMAIGATDNGKPGERPYHPGYYAAYLLDPDGNNIEAVFHGPAERSAESVVLRALS
jgi:catechol 2,3-dioxygenase-like lactoylglutathione lyase family enzyme